MEAVSALALGLAAATLMEENPEPAAAAEEEPPALSESESELRLAAILFCLSASSWKAKKIRNN